MTRKSRPSLLVGSVNLPGREAVFDAVSRRLRDDIRYVPDGETGDRKKWVAWELNRIADLPEVVVDDAMFFRHEAYGEQRVPTMSAAEGVDLAAVDFGPWRYADEAVPSYETFVAEREAGKFRSDARFQVSLPTPMMFAMNFPNDLATIRAALEGELGDEVERMLRGIPAADLALQWDVAGEVIAQEQLRAGGVETWTAEPTWPISDATDSVARASVRLPDDALLGVHLCYGDPEGEHLVPPKDLRVPVEFANSCARAIRRRLDWVHMPVPIEREDDSFFAPLADLELASETTLYLGLIHKEDGVEGARRRIAAASKYVEDFGIATECGMGREPSDRIDDLLILHHEASTS